MILSFKVESTKMSSSTKDWSVPVDSDSESDEYYNPDNDWICEECQEQMNGHTPSVCVICDREMCHICAVDFFKTVELYNSVYEDTADVCPGACYEEGLEAEKEGKIAVDERDKAKEKVAEDEAVELKKIKDAKKKENKALGLTPTGKIKKIKNKV